MALHGLDYAGGRPGGAAIKAAGYGFVCRYLVSGGTSLPGKLLTLAEYADLQRNGISVAVNFETTADRMKAGYTAGVSDAHAADAMARAVGHPPDRPIFFSADWDATPADQAEIDDYLRGCASVIGIDRVGIYGGYWVVKRCLDNHTATWAWQTMAWSGGQQDPRAHILQHIDTAVIGGVECDINEALQDDFGQHPAPSTPARKATPDMLVLAMNGQGNLRFPCPVGSASAITAQAWLSIIANGPRTPTDKLEWKPGHFDIYFQSDTGGISEAHWDIDFDTPNGRSDRKWMLIPDGTTQINIEHTIVGAATAAVEFQPK